MEKDSKNKQDKPQTQGWDKTDRNFQRTANEEDVRGEMEVREHHKNDDKKKPHNKNEKNNR